VRSSSRRLALKEEFFSLRLPKGKRITNHIQWINILKTQIVGVGLTMTDEDLVSLVLITNLEVGYSSKHSKEKQQ
jgi:hypothetical protein